MIRNVQTNTAIEKFTKERENLNRITMFELNEKYADYPTEIKEYTVNGKKYIVHSHFVGEKDVDTIIRSIAFTRALAETLSEKAA